MTFGLIAEGPTDLKVLRFLLAKYFSNTDIDIRPIQPNTDSTDKIDHFGGWKKVLDYCSSNDMLSVLEYQDYVIIQIDTDVCEEYGVKRRISGRDLTSDQLIVATKSKIIDHIGGEIYEQYQDKILMAICHESMECWLLPLYFTNNTKSKTINCCDTLNQELKKQEDFTIDCTIKKPKYFEYICKQKLKSKNQIVAISQFNPGFSMFIESLSIIPST